MIYQLSCFSSSSRDIEASVEVSLGDCLEVSYNLSDPSKNIFWPQSVSSPQFQERLYEATCFEFFVRSGEYYLEWNFSPNLNWAVYAFSSYRSTVKVERAKIPVPLVVCDHSDSSRVVLSAKVDLFNTIKNTIDIKPSDDLKASATCVLDLGDCLGYWAVTHSGNKPDFHLPESFSIKL